ncbi:MAG: Transcriptional regulator, AcrR family, partial [uncultured Solirubrobacteraceae bacterium]
GRGSDRPAGAQEAAHPRGDHRCGARALRRARVRAHDGGEHRGGGRHRAADVLRLLRGQGGRGLPRLRGALRRPARAPRPPGARRDRDRRDARVDRRPDGAHRLRGSPGDPQARAHPLHAVPARARPRAHVAVRDRAGRRRRLRSRPGPGTAAPPDGRRRRGGGALDARGLLRRQGGPARRRRRPHGGRGRGPDVPPRRHRGAARAPAGAGARPRLRRV